MPSSRSRRMPLAVVAGMVMAFVVGWVVVRAFNNSEPRRAASSSVFTPSVPTSAPGRTPAAFGTSPAPVAPSPAPPSTSRPASAEPGPRAEPGEDAAESQEEAEGQESAAPTTLPSARSTSPRPPSPEGSLAVVRPEIDTGATTAEERAERAVRQGALRRALHRRDAVSRRCEELRRQLDVGVITDTEEYQRTQALLDEALDELERLDAEVNRLRAEINGG